jgi:4,5-DOPA dioxygenase extradiol
MLVLEDRPATTFLRQLSTRLPRPAAVIAVSAHWETEVPTVSLAERPETIHDFFGFPAELFAQQYPAPGAPETAQRAAELLQAAGFAAETAVRGLDHGAWTPMKLAWPEADVAVAQLSIQPHLGPANHYAVGQALAPLRAEGVLILGTGALTHNLGQWRRHRGRRDAPDWVAAFADWIEARLAAGDTEALLDYRARAPYAAENHPTDEHLLPLFVALGAGGPAAPPHATTLHRSYADGVLAMDSYAFA